MTDTVFNHLTRIREAVEKGSPIDLWLPLAVAEDVSVCNMVMRLMTIVAIQEGFSNYYNVGEHCGKELCLKFIEKVEDYYEEISVISARTRSFNVDRLLIDIPEMCPWTNASFT